jgi:hypothetical protein
MPFSQAVEMTHATTRLQPLAMQPVADSSIAGQITTARDRRLDIRPGEACLSSLDPPQVDLHLDARFRPARMRLALIAGVRPVNESWSWSIVGRDGTPTGEFLRARLYAFTKTGWRVCQFDSSRLFKTLRCGEGWTHFQWRVLVEGSWERPDSVEPVWIIEGHDRPIPVRFYFQ